jgi:hypothetical protein
MLAVYSGCMAVFSLVVIVKHFFAQAARYFIQSVWHLKRNVKQLLHFKSNCYCE